MNFKLITLSAVILTLNACSWLRTDPKNNSSFQAPNLDLSCMQVVPSQLQLLFGGKLGDSDQDQAQIRLLFGCLDRTLDSFSSYTRGATSGTYSVKELGLFANRYLPDDNQASDLLVGSIFRIKKAVVGGSEYTLSQAEILSLRKILTRLGGILSPFSKHIGVLLDIKPAKEDDRRMASLALNAFVLELAKLLEDSANSLPWQDLALFIRELDEFTKQNSGSALTIVKEQIPIFQYVKLLIVGGSEISIEREKWSPIFEAISKFYDALYLTTNTTEMLEKLDVDVKATEKEQLRATQQLTSLLKALKQDETLRSKSSIRALSDRFSKVLILNAMLFPSEQGSLSIKTFFSSPALRKISGLIVDDLVNIDVNNIEPGKIRRISENIAALIEQAGNAAPTQRTNSEALNLTKLIEYVKTLESLFEKQSDHKLFTLGMNVVQNLVPIIIGEDGTNLTPKELRILIEKATEAYLAWIDPKVTAYEAVATTLAQINRHPFAYTIPSLAVENALLSIEKLTTELATGKKFDFQLYREWIQRAFKTKAVLFQNSEISISNFELNQIAFLFEPFKNKENLGEALEEVASLLQIRTFQNASLSDIYDLIDQYLPKSKKLADYKISKTLFSQIKMILIGGSDTFLARFEYSELAKAASQIYLSVMPKVNSLPDEFKFGLNSDTFEVVSLFFDSYIRSRKGTIPLSALHVAFKEFLRANRYPVNEPILVKFWAGISTRILKNNKGPKPSDLNSIQVSAEDFSPLSKTSLLIAKELKALESIYHHHQTTRLSKATLLSEIESKDGLAIINGILPLISETGLHFADNGEAQDTFLKKDLAFKFTIYQAVKAIFPFYQVSNRNEGASNYLGKADLIDLLTDLNDLITDLGLSYGYSPPERSANSRIRSINLFTRSGNGDENIDLIETTEFLTITFGGKEILSLVENELKNKCHPSLSDLADMTTIPITCLTETYFNEDFLVKAYGTVVPQLVETYRGWNNEDRDAFRKAVLTATDSTWTERGVLSRVDLEPLVSIPYYIEALFQRFDGNKNDVLEFSEAYSGFPLFCKEIKKLGGDSLKGSCDPGYDPDQIEAIYGYLIFKGKAPSSPETGVWRKLIFGKEMLGWFRYWRRLDKRPESRDSLPPMLNRKELLQIMSNLNS